MLLRCKLFNARSLCNKLSNLHLLLHSYDFDIIFITESWLNGDLSDSLLLSGSSYYILRKDRYDGYGGVLVFIQNSLKVVNNELTTDFLQLECIILDVMFSYRSMYRFVCVYNPPALANDISHTTLLCSIQLQLLCKLPCFLCWRL